MPENSDTQNIRSGPTSDLSALNDQPQNTAGDNRATAPTQWPCAIQPTPIEIDGVHQTDPDRRRATFQVPYPRLEVVLEHKIDLDMKLPPRFETNGRRTINGVRLFLKVANLAIGKCDFISCKFHRPRERGESIIAGTTFRKCNFEKCIFGGSIYRHVRFDRCVFRRCDFGMSQFIDCNFQACQFEQCTGEHVSFSATEISPSEFLGGMVIPFYNYGIPYDGEPSREALESDWLKIRKGLAAQLVKSNEEIHHNGYCDAALVELKAAELQSLHESLKSRPLSAGLPFSWLRYFFLRLILALTKGGTSLARLASITLFTIPIYTLLLSFSSVTFEGTPCRILDWTASALIEQAARAASLFLAIGYTAFVGHNGLEVVLLTLGATFGLFWYALLAAVVIRRVYR